MPLSVVFMGTPDFAVPTLTEIIGAGHTIEAVYTQPPRPAGRGMEPKKSPVHTTAERFGLTVLTPENFKSDDDRKVFRSHDADVAVVVAYGLLLPNAILDVPVNGCVNLHASLLPRWRGAAPIQRAVMAGDSESGVAVMQMEKGLDTGPVAMMERTAITPDMTSGELHDALARTGADLMHRALGAIERGSLSFDPQPDTGATYAKKIEKAEARIDWSFPVETVHNQIRGLSPFPGAWCEIEIGDKTERLKVLKTTRTDGSGTPGEILQDDLTVACGDGALRILSVQRAGKQVMTADAFARGVGISKGGRLL
ncbi:MAG: methionyl-tRNA formyltransferase [Pseudomonadota bacterium]